MSVTNQNSIKELLMPLHRDAVLWKAERLWSQAADPDEQAGAMEDIVEMLCCISNDIKRVSYCKLISDAITEKIKANAEQKKSLQQSITATERKLSKLENKKKQSPNDETEIKQLHELLLADKELQEKISPGTISPLSEALIKKAVTEELKTREAKRQAAIAKQKLENQFNNASDAGLAEGFTGNIYDALKYGIYEHEGVYYSRGAKGSDYPVTNFTMKIIYHVDTSDESAFRLISVKNVWGFETVININTDDFVSLGPFKKVLARRGDYIFKGTDSDLSRLQELLQKDEVKSTYVKTLGWNKRGKFYAFANGIFPINKEFIQADDYGIIEHDSKKYFIPAVSKMFADKDDQFVNEKKFIYREPVAGFGFTEWANLFYKTYGNKSIAGILFYIGSLYRDIIMKQLQRYPILCLFGPPGAGKGQMAESLMSMFGEKQDQIMLGGASTVVGFMRKFAQFANAIVWLDEYKNNLPMKFIESFKNIYDGKGYERGKMTNDFATESTPIHSSCILSGQDMPTIEPALFMRTILLSFEDGKFTEEQRRSFQELKDIEAPGLSYISTQLLQYRDIIEKEFKEQQRIIEKQTIKDVANVEVDDRMILNISMLLTFYHLLKDKITLPFTYAETKSFLIDNMMHQHTILAGNNDVAKFWQVVESLFHQGIIFEGKDFELKDGYIFLCLSKVHPWYMKELKQRGDPNGLSSSTMKHYLELDKTIFIDYKKKRFEDGSNNYVHQMKYSKIGIDLIKIKREATDSDDQYKLRIKQKEAEMNGEQVETPTGGDSLPFGNWKPVE